MKIRKSRNYETSGIDGEVTLFGVNIFDYPWHSTHKKIKVSDPLYHRAHTFEIYTVLINGVKYKFAAGKFSNCFR